MCYFTRKVEYSFTVVRVRVYLAKGCTTTQGTESLCFPLTYWSEQRKEHETDVARSTGEIQNAYEIHLFGS
jgi:hypothetical protein